MSRVNSRKAAKAENGQDVKMVRLTNGNPSSSSDEDDLTRKYFQVRQPPQPKVTRNNPSFTVAPPKPAPVSDFPELSVPVSSSNAAVPTTLQDEKPAPSDHLTLTPQQWKQLQLQKPALTIPQFIRPPPTNFPTVSTPPPPEVSTSPSKVSKEAENLLRAISPYMYFNDKFLKSGKFSASVLTRDSEHYSDVLDYVINSQAPDFGVKVEYVIKVDRTADVESQDCAASNSSTSLKMMLWHGTKARVLGQILEGGFRTPAFNYQMFGQGIYFADRISKSAQYCFDARGRPYPGTTGYFFLCEVQLGRIYNANNPNPSYTSPPGIVKTNGEVLPCNSLMCSGNYIPDRERQKIIDDVIWCVGPTVKNTDTCNLQYNEFIVYDPNQVKIKYLLKVQFTPTPYSCYDNSDSD